MTPPVLPAVPAFPIDLYVNRNLSIDEFVSWARGGPTGNPEGDPPTRLRSVIGSPGSGKSTFLVRLRQKLTDQRFKVLWLDVASLEATAKGLTAWLNNTINDSNLGGHGFNPDSSHHDKFNNFLRKLEPGHIVLLVDSFEEIDPKRREELEAMVFLPFLFPPKGKYENENRYLIIARRDEYSLQEALLHWEDDVYTLEGLDFVTRNGPIEQVRRRLAAVAAEPTNARVILEWEEGDGELTDEAIASISGLDDAGREGVCNGLGDHLTPNPFVNIKMLHRQLIHPHDPIAAADYDVCLTRYARRAGLPEGFTTVLRDHASALDAKGEITKLNLNKADGRNSEDIERLMAAGIYVYVSGGLRYKMDPTVRKLANPPAGWL